MILNFGSLNIDYVYSINHIVQPGETLSSNQLEFHAGGKGANQSVAIARAALSTQNAHKIYHFGKIGKDGLHLKQLLQENEVETDFIIIDKEVKTGHAIIQVTEEGENAIILFGGANQSFKEEEIDQCLNHFLNEQNKWLIMQNEVNLENYMARKAKEMNFNIIWNPAPFSRELNLELADFLIFNETEAIDCLGSFKIAGSSKTNILGDVFSHDELYIQLITGLYKKFPSASGIFLTLGSKGSLSAFKKNDSWQIFYVKPFPCAVKDTTGAGDTFVGYWAREWVETVGDKIWTEEQVLQCQQLASKAAAKACETKGAITSIPDRKSL